MPGCEVSFGFRLVGDAVGSKAVHLVLQAVQIAATFVAAFVMRSKLLTFGWTASSLPGSNLLQQNERLAQSLCVHHISRQNLMSRTSVPTMYQES
jgi:hypothetical protein